MIKFLYFDDSHQLDNVTGGGFKRSFAGFTELPQLVSSGLAAARSVAPHEEDTN